MDEKSEIDRQLRELESQNDFMQSEFELFEDKLDMVYFYSKPLAKRIHNLFKSSLFEDIPTNDMLNTNLEYSRLLLILKNTNRKFSIMNEAVNFETFKQVQTKEPKIIHISCHGDFDQQSKEFYL